VVDKIEKQFKNKGLFEQAFVHRSWVNEHPGTISSNERMEFLGDAILEYIVSASLYKSFPNEEEGYLTALRASLVNTQNLAEIATKLGLGNRLMLSKGEEEGGGKGNQSLLADTLEALVGAIYLDQGIVGAEEFVVREVLTLVPSKIARPLKDAKSRLQEFVQGRGHLAPIYKVRSETGPDHNKTFLIDVVLDKVVYGKGEGKSKSTAEQSAAQNALINERLEKLPNYQ